MARRTDNIPSPQADSAVPPSSLRAGGIRVDLVMAEAPEHDQALGLARLVEECLALFGRHQAVIICGDERDRAWGDLVDDPLGVELQRLVDVLELPCASGQSERGYRDTLAKIEHGNRLNFDTAW